VGNPIEKKKKEGKKKKKKEVRESCIDRSGG